MKITIARQRLCPTSAKVFSGATVTLCNKDGLAMHPYAYGLGVAELSAAPGKAKPVPPGKCIRFTVRTGTATKTGTIRLRENKAGWMELTVVAKR